MIGRAALAVVIATGCGGGGGGGEDPDARPDADPNLPCTEDELIGMFRAIPEPTAASRYGGQLHGEVTDRPYPVTLATMAEIGGCRYVAPSPALCEPACTGMAICDATATCVEFPAVTPAGTVTLTGSTPAIELEPVPGYGGYYTTQGYPGLYARDDELVLTVEGDGAVAGFALTTIGVPPIELPTQMITATEHEDLTIGWNAVGGIADAEVMIHLDNDHHGIRAYVECVAPASAGSLVVPAAVLDPLILAGETGIGTYIENAWIEQRRRVTTRTANGCVAFASHSDDFLFVETIRAP
jgi:hypothetical protein